MDQFITVYAIVRFMISVNLDLLIKLSTFFDLDQFITIVPTILGSLVLLFCFNKFTAHLIAFFSSLSVFDDLQLNNCGRLVTAQPFLLRRSFLKGEPSWESSRYSGSLPCTARDRFRIPFRYSQCQWFCIFH